MVARSVLAEPALQRQIDAFFDADDFVAGLVLGHSTDSRDLIVHLAPTPAGTEEEGDDEVPAPKVTRVEDLDVEWMLEHHRQISRLLPGGIEIIGAFFVSTADVFQSQVGLTHCRKLLRAMSARDADAGPLFSAGGRGNDYLLLHLDRRERTVRAKLADASPAASARLTDADFRVCASSGGDAGNSAGGGEADVDLAWQKVEGSFLLDLPVVFSEEETTLTVQKKVTLALQPLARCVQEAEVLFDSACRSSAELLDRAQAPTSISKSSNKKKGKRAAQKEDVDDETGQDGDSAMKTYHVQFLLSSDYASTLDDCKTESVYSRMKFGGKMSVCAFLPARATVEEAVRAVKRDLLRSLHGRMQMHCDSLVGDDMNPADSDVPVLHEPPRRVLLRLPASLVCVSDYLYPGETTDDSAESVEEVFGFKPDPEFMDDELEMVAGPKETMSASGDSDDSRPASPEDLHLHQHRHSLLEASRCSPLILVSAILVLGVAVGLPLWYNVANLRG